VGPTGWKPEGKRSVLLMKGRRSERIVDVKRGKKKEGMPYPKRGGSRTT